MALLEIERLRKSYGRTEILRDVSLTVERGEVLGLVGPTGSGKTTLLRLINLLDRPDQGSIRFDGVQVTSLTNKELLPTRRRMAMVFQKPVMFRASVRENVFYGLRVRGQGGQLAEEKALEALKEVGLSGCEDRDANTLSGGEMQRVALARAMVLQPELLLLDEPTANLDPRTAATIDQLISGHSRQNAAVIVATHNMQQCRRLADRVAVLVDGRLVALGRPEAVFGDAAFAMKGLSGLGLISPDETPW